MEKSKGKKKGSVKKFLSGLINRLDEKMLEKAAKGQCCGPSAKGGSSCCS